MTNTVKQQILAIRATGETNMFDVNRVQHIANRKGYYELVRQQERVEQPRHQLTDEEALELSARLAALRKGDMVRVTYYDQDAYTSIRGAVTRIDEPFRTLRVVMTDIPFDDILRIEDGGAT